MEPLLDDDYSEDDNSQDNSGGSSAQVNAPATDQIIYMPSSDSGGGGGGYSGGPGWGPLQPAAQQTTTAQTTAQAAASAQSQQSALGNIWNQLGKTPETQPRQLPPNIHRRKHFDNDKNLTNNKNNNMADPTLPTPPPGATKEQSGLNVHPMSVEAQHITVGAIVGLVIGLFIGYFEMHRQKAGWGTLAGFAIGGLLLGMGVGFAIPPRKKVEVKGADGRTEIYYCD